MLSNCLKKNTKSCTTATRSLIHSTQLWSLSLAFSSSALLLMAVIPTQINYTICFHPLGTTAFPAMEKKTKKHMVLQALSNQLYPAFIQLNNPSLSHLKL